jgi:hypothetical protein
MTIKLPALWQPTQYIRPINIEHGGNMAQTHLALLRTEQGKPVRGYVKHYGQHQPRGLLNEWLGYAIQAALGVPQPECAILQAPLPGTAMMGWAFVSLEPVPTVQGTPKQLYNLTDPQQHQALIKRLMACPALPLLVAADQLLGNNDRNMGNLVFTGKQQFVAIDQGGILGGLHWTLADLWFAQQWARSKPIEDLTPIQSLSPSQKNAIFAAAELVEQAFFEQQKELRSALGASHNTEVHTAMHAIWWRAFFLAQWFRNRLDLL